MASKTINTILNLKDNMSGKLIKTSKRVNGLSKEARLASVQVANMANKFKDGVSKMAASGAKLAIAGAGIAGAFAFKTGFSEALDLEGYKIQLETATKDTKKAGEIMKYAMDLANKTPFEAGPLIEGASKLEMLGVSAKKYLPMLGDMAAATNKPIDQAVEAMLDAQMGEFERLKEFGIKKQMIIDKANQMFKGKEIVNKKGQIKDEKAFNQALEAVMQERYGGGMERQAKTVRGTWSTVTGITKTALAEIVGMTADGTIRQGSALAVLKDKVTQIAKAFEQWQQDGTIKRISEQATRVFTSIYTVVEKVITFIVKYRAVIGTIALIFVSMSIGIKVAMMLKTVITALQIAWALFNGTLALTPLGWIAVTIAAVIAAGVLLWKNWDTVKAKAIELWGYLTETWTNIKTSISGTVMSMAASISSSIETIKAGFINAFGAIGNFVGGILKGIANNYITIFNFIFGILNKIKFKMPDWIPAIGGKEFGFNLPVIPKFATGTPYFKGGLARINERGGELVDLPNGSKVIPADKTDKMLGGKNIIVNVNIAGNVIGNDQYADYVGDIIVKKLQFAMVK